MRKQNGRVARETLRVLKNILKTPVLIAAAALLILLEGLAVSAASSLPVGFQELAGRQTSGTISNGATLSVDALREVATNEVFVAIGNDALVSLNVRGASGAETVGAVLGAFLTAIPFFLLLLLMRTVLFSKYFQSQRALFVSDARRSGVLQQMRLMGPAVLGATLLPIAGAVLAAVPGVLALVMLDAEGGTAAFCAALSITGGVVAYAYVSLGLMFATRIAAFENVSSGRQALRLAWRQARGRRLVYATWLLGASAVRGLGLIGFVLGPFGFVTQTLATVTADALLTRHLLVLLRQVDEDTTPIRLETKLRADARGLTSIEYVMLLCLLAIAGVLAWQGMASAVSTRAEQAATTIARLPSVQIDTTPPESRTLYGDFGTSAGVHTKTASHANASGPAHSGPSATSASAANRWSGTTDGFFGPGTNSGRANQIARGAADALIDFAKRPSTVIGAGLAVGAIALGAPVALATVGAAMGAGLLITGAWGIFAHPIATFHTLEHAGVAVVEAIHHPGETFDAARDWSKSAYGRLRDHLATADAYRLSREATGASIDLAQLGLAVGPLAKGTRTVAAASAESAAATSTAETGALAARAAAASRVAAPTADDLASMTAGLCFTGETLVRTDDDYKAISRIHVGERVRTIGDDACRESKIDRSEYSLVELRARDTANQPVHVQTLRRKSWIKQIGATVGAFVAFTLPDAAHASPAEVLSISPAPHIEEGDGCTVLSTFESESHSVVNVALASGVEIHATEKHPFFSADRHTWVAAASLQLGERIATDNGIAQVDSVKSLEGSFTVYNLEVDRLHTYLVSEANALVHNNGCAAQDPLLRQMAARLEQAAAGNGFDLALGLAKHRTGGGGPLLQNFSNRTASTNYFRLYGTGWPGTWSALQDTIKQAMQRANRINFNLDQMDIAKLKAYAANPTFGSKNITNWELYTVLTTPELLAKTTFYGRGGAVVGAPAL